MHMLSKKTLKRKGTTAYVPEKTKITIKSRTSLDALTFGALSPAPKGRGGGGGGGQNKAK